MQSMQDQFNEEQKRAFSLIESGRNLFLTGGAGSGKSFVIKALREKYTQKEYPLLASTGVAAVLLGGQTFHSFFRLGLMEGGMDASIERALKDKKLQKKLKEMRGFIIDEVSMLSSSAFRAAEAICRLQCNPQISWGGLQVIAVGDFAQLPPVNIRGQKKDWVFSDPAWIHSEFENIYLRENHRCEEPEFLRMLNKIRVGDIDEEILEFCKERLIDPGLDFEGTRLYARKKPVEDFNLEKLEELSGQSYVFDSVYSGDAKNIEKLKKSSPIPEYLEMKENAFVMLRQNDPLGRWVNGSLGYIRDFGEDKIVVELLNGDWVEVKQSSFHLLNEDSEVCASVSNYPLQLAYASTIHKSQGCTLDAAAVDLSSLWEPGHAYVAMSRVKRSSGLYILGFRASSFKADPIVLRFYQSFG